MNVQRRGKEKYAKSSAVSGDGGKEKLGRGVHCLTCLWAACCCPVLGHTSDITNATVEIQGHISPGSQSCFCLSVHICFQQKSSQEDCGLCPNTQIKAPATCLPFRPVSRCSGIHSTTCSSAKILTWWQSLEQLLQGSAGSNTTRDNPNLCPMTEHSRRLIALSGSGQSSLFLGYME